MKGESRRLVCVCLLGLWVCSSAAHGQKRRLPVWEEAARTYGTAMSLYKLGDWKQTARTLKDFIRRFPSNEHIPLAYLQLAHCSFLIRDAKTGNESLDKIIRRFPDSRASFLAWGHKLHQARARKDYDGYLKLYQTMVRKMGGQAPLSIGTRLDWRHYGSYYHYYHTSLYWPRTFRTGFTQRAAHGGGWPMRLLTVANTPERAEWALKILKATLARHGQDLPLGWKFVHVSLLRRAATGKKLSKPRAVSLAKEAEVKFKSYLKAWPEGDPRVMGFWLLEAEYALSQKDDKKAEGIYQRLMKDYGGFVSLRDRLPRWLAHLYARKRHKDYFELTRWYLKKYPRGPWRDTSLAYWVNLAKELAAPKPKTPPAKAKPAAKGKKPPKAKKVEMIPGDPAQIKVVMKLLDEEQQRHRLNPQRVKNHLTRRIDLLLVLGEVPEAVKLAEKLVGEEHWSAETFKHVQGLTKRNKAFEPVVASARSKWDVPVPDKKSPAAALLKNLRKRIKDNQLRHMEEIGDKMYAEHRRDAHTIEAVRLLVDYYYRKVLHEKRNKWAKGMIRAYPYHPYTQAVMGQQIGAELAAKKYEALAPLVTAAMSRFPGAGPWPSWWNYRISCFNAAKDYEGRIKYVRQHLSKRVQAGELWAIGTLGTYEVALKRWKQRGDYWLEQAKKYAGTCKRNYCLERAFNAYFLTPRRRWEIKAVDFRGAIRAARALRDQDLDPEMRWKMAFEDINLMSQANSGPAALKTLVARLKEEKVHPFNLSDRLDFSNLGRALGSLGSAGLSMKAKTLLDKVKRLCRSKADLRAQHVMLAIMFQMNGKYAPAAKQFLMAKKASPWPITQYAVHYHAMNCLKSSNPAQYTAGNMQYIRRVRTAQDLVPRVLLQLGQYHWKSRQVGMKYYRMLVKSYSSSSQRGVMERMRAGKKGR